MTGKKKEELNSFWFKLGIFRFQLGVAFGQDRKGGQSASIHWLVRHGETWRGGSAGRGLWGAAVWAEKVTWQGVRGKLE